MSKDSADAATAVFPFSPVKLVANLLPCFVASGIMFLFGTILQRASTNIMWQFVSIALCCFVYFVALSFSKQYREEIVMKIMEKIKNTKEKVGKDSETVNDCTRGCKETMEISENSKSRESFVEIARGIGIVLVVVGHAISKEMAAHNQIADVVKILRRI